MPKLIKASPPGWVKNYDNLNELREELLQHICKACLLGGEWTDFDENGVTNEMEMVRKAPDPTSIYDLLSTPCGCEFWIDEVKEEERDDLN